MTEASGDEWYNLAEHQANPVQVDMLSKARRELADAKKVEAPGRMVAALPFGYWTAMVGKEYEGLWQTALNRIARRDDGRGLTRKAFSKPLAPIRTLRNRIAHHEPILHWSLPRHYDAILELIGWLSPVAAQWCRDCSRFESIYPVGGVELFVARAADRTA